MLSVLKFQRFTKIATLNSKNMRSDPYCHCGACGHEKVSECYTKQCSCCLTDHQGAFGKNR